MTKEREKAIAMTARELHQYILDHGGPREKEELRRIIHECYAETVQAEEEGGRHE